MERGNGILMHITSLPSKHGIGTFGKEARNFVKFLHLAGQKYWQVLPLNPTSYGDSPYQSFSAFALNPYFVDLEILIKKGFLTTKETRVIKGGSNPSYVDFGKVYEERFLILRKAFENGYQKEEAKIIKFAKKQKFWIHDYACYMMIKKLFNDVSWLEWPRLYKSHQKGLIEKTRLEHLDDYNFYIWIQFQAYEQYKSLRKYANSKGIKMIGDMPIYVALDSADVWANPKLFMLDKRRNPALVAGVPPDYFSETGQLWGNPIYNWEVHEKTNFRWWKKRTKAMAALYDCLRIDHFRGFEAYWAIKFGEPTAIKGTWIKGPDKKIIDAFKMAAPKLQIIAEDLGVITPEVEEMLAYSGYPGLKILQFAFDGSMANKFLPHNYQHDCVAYIGTHDNDVTVNFLIENLKEKELIKKYLNCLDDKQILDAMIKKLLESNANVTILMMQDVLKLDKYARMNIPGTPSGNWQFRVLKPQLSKELALYIYHLCGETKRL